MSTIEYASKTCSVGIRSSEYISVLKYTSILSRGPACTVRYGITGLGFLIKAPYLIPTYCNGVLDSVGIIVRNWVRRRNPILGIIVFHHTDIS
jgi:hypothetical protein